MTARPHERQSITYSNSGPRPALAPAHASAGRTGADHIGGMFRVAHHPVSSIDVVSNVSMNTTSLWDRRLARESSHRCSKPPAGHRPA